MALSMTLAPFHCAHCSYADPSWDRLKAHIEANHMTEAACSYCGRYRLVLIEDDGQFYCVDDSECA